MGTTALEISFISSYENVFANTFLVLLTLMESPGFSRTRERLQGLNSLLLHPDTAPQLFLSAFLGDVCNVPLNKICHQTVDFKMENSNTTL